jgi:hypothetical protein
MNPNGKTVAVHGASEPAYTAVAAMPAQRLFLPAVGVVNDVYLSLPASQ